MDNNKHSIQCLENAVVIVFSFIFSGYIKVFLRSKYTIRILNIIYCRRKGCFILLIKKRMPIILTGTLFFIKIIMEGKFCADDRTRTYTPHGTRS